MNNNLKITENNVFLHKKTMKIVFELPFFSSICGGVMATVRLAEQMGADLHFQRLTGHKPVTTCRYTVGTPPVNFDHWITYSDNPFVHPKTDAVMMLSYGMSIAQERRNALKTGWKVMCSTKKIEDSIRKNGGNPIRVGFDINTTGLKNENRDRKRYLAIMAHDMPSKQYAFAARTADNLYNDGVIEGTVIFGQKHPLKPKSMVKSYYNANRSQINEVFNQCKCYLMPSTSEGLNLTPIESTLCGCPAIILDGAIGELFYDRYNVTIGTEHIEAMIDNYDMIAPIYQERMENIVQPYTIKTVADNVLSAITNNFLS